MSRKVKEIIEEAFPNFNIEEEYHIRINNQSLFMDFFIPRLSLVFEVDGAQHDAYSEFFHGNAKGFSRSKKRDNLKHIWAEENDITIIRFNPNDVKTLTKDILLQTIEEAIDGC